MNKAESLRSVNEREAAEILGFSVRTLQNRRYLGQPPTYVKLGRTIRYKLADLEAFLMSSTVAPRSDAHVA
ncbi:MAG: helix-turn-helix domain-containing protein [Mailhella sp.]|nr:helix-turn-helix domain-containing protein [Mailhella sp.]